MTNELYDLDLESIDLKKGYPKNSRVDIISVSLSDEDLSYIVDSIIAKTKLEDKLDYVLWNLWNYATQRVEDMVGTLESEAKMKRHELSFSAGILVIGLTVLFAISFSAYLVSIGQVNEGKSFIYPALFGLITIAWMLFKKS